ncbi:MAG: glycosyltransferase family 1 protein [Alphaproteobacteria bacterium]|nr:glycosyltransferase family 1 protein [Alphaproteobacteria bacterium]
MTADVAPALSARRLLFVVTEDWFFWQHYRALAAAARTAGFEVAVATRVAHHAERIEAAGFRLHPLAMRRGTFGPLANLRAIVELHRLFRRERPDLVQLIALQPIVLGGFAARLARVPRQVATVTGLGFAFTSRTWAAPCIRLLVRAALGRLSRRPGIQLIFQNPDDPARLGPVIDGTRASVVRGAGVDLELFRPVPRPAAPRPVTVAIVARMIEMKGIATAVSAIERLHGAGVAIRLRLVGAPDPGNPTSLATSELETWSRHPAIDWTGPSEDVPGVWAESDIALLPSLGGEGTPNSLIEAAASGRPLVASDIPGCREIVEAERNGILVPPGDPAALAAALRRLAGDADLRQRFGLAARQLAESQFSAGHLARQTIAVYERTFAEVPRSGPPQPLGQ